MEGRQIRETFLRFFEERAHRRVSSSSLIPPPDSGLLLTNAGMNQFIPYFLGHSQPPFARAVTAQKVFRALDIENVGYDAATSFWLSRSRATSACWIRSTSRASNSDSPHEDMAHPDDPGARHRGSLLTDRLG